MRIVDNVKSRFQILGELLGFFWQNKWWWLVPMILMLLVFALLIALAQNTALGPLIYTLF